MPRYPFRCSLCGLAFDVSRSMSEASAPATCPVDGSAAERVFVVPQMAFKRPAGAEPPAPPRSSGYSHHGHSHGPGVGHHTH